MATMHLIHGFIGFGKSTIAKKLAHELPAVHLANDEFMVKLYGRNPPSELFKDYYNRIDDMIWGLTEKIIKTGTDVILDYGFWTKEKRAFAYNHARTITENVVFHNIQCDMDTARQCVIERTKRKNDELTIDENTFDLFKPQFEPISSDENYPVINHDNNIKEWKYAAYILPVPEINGEKQVALAVYKSGWYGLIGGRLDENETPNEAVCREVCEELGEKARFITDKAVRIKKLIDIRLWRVARFVPWASGINLEKLLGERYSYMPELAPTKELLSAYKDGQIDWAGYEKIFNGILAQQQVENLFMSAIDKQDANSYKFVRSETGEQLFQPDELDGVCFLCSEKTADKCHRRLVVEYLAAKLPEVEIVHL